MPLPLSRRLRCVCYGSVLAAAALDNTAYVASHAMPVQRLSETKSQQDQLQGRLREVLVSTLTDLARKEKAEQEQELIRSSFTMGRITARRYGPQFLFHAAIKHIDLLLIASNVGGTQ